MRRTSPARSVSLTSLVIAIAMACVGCAHGASAEERQLAKLSDDLARVQADHDRFEQRLDKLEIDRADDHPVTHPPAPPARSGATPMATPHDLRVVHLGPGSDDGGAGDSPPGSASRASSASAPSPEASALNGEDPNDTTPRPSIRVQGGQTLGGRSARTRGAAAQHVEETLPPEEPNGGASGPAVGYPASDRDRDRAHVSALDPDAKRAYDAALALVGARRYPEALDAFAAFLVRWPDHPNADNAMYWRGESYFAQGELGRAAEQFEGVIARFPMGNKVPDSLLKLGICQQRLKNPAAARAQFSRLQREYPRSEAARRVPSLPESK
jgi:tol-pal system protein YbgF